VTAVPALFFTRTDTRFARKRSKRFARGPASVTIGVMIARPGKLVPSSRTLAASAAVLAIFAIEADPVWPQAAPQPVLGVQEQGQPSPPQADSAPEPSQATPEKPGLIHEMGKLFGRILPLKSPSETIDDLNSSAKGAGDALSRLAKPSSMVSGRTICPIAVNSAPDCKLAADKLCQSKGYKEGKSLNTDSAETCSAKVLIPGRKRKPDDCRTDNYVTSAVCQ
jgi:hypothetical protein